MRSDRSGDRSQDRSQDRSGNRSENRSENRSGNRSADRSEEIKLLEYFVDMQEEGNGKDKRLYVSTSELKHTGIENGSTAKIRRLLGRLKGKGLIKEGFEVSDTETCITLTQRGLQYFETEKENAAEREDGKKGGGNRPLKKDPLQKHYDSIHKLVMDKFIKKRYKDANPDKDIFQKYSDLFKVFVKVMNEEKKDLEEEKKDLEEGGLFEFIARKIDTSSNENFIKILGPDGTGKSTFLSLLYLYLYERFSDGEIHSYPFYINLHYYDRQVIEGNNIAEINQKAEQEIRNDLKELGELSKKVEEKNLKEPGELSEKAEEQKIKLLIIIDGNEKYQRTHLDAKSILQRILDTMKGHKKIICIGEKTNVHSMRGRQERRFYEETAYAFQFSTIYISQENEWKDVIQKYCSIVHKENQKKNIVDCIHSFRIKEVDFNLLTVFGECSGKYNLKEIASIGNLYHKYCMDCLDNAKDKMETSIELSYKYFMTEEYIQQQYISQHWQEWELVHQHKTISNYLLACYYAEMIREYDGKNLQKFECVFTNGINIFLKSILNDDKKDQKPTLRFCESAFKNGDFRTQSQAAYLAGRIQSKENDNELPEKARSLLKKQLLKWSLKGADSENKKRELYFLRRTILVSLLNLGSVREGKWLLGELFDVSVMNEVNRAFYLQYYEDVNSELGKINLIDDGTSPVTYTTSVLLNYIYNGLQKSKPTPAEEIEFQIHVFTFCSLVQRRWENGMKTGLTEKMLHIIKLIEDRRISLNENMRIYLKMLKTDLSDGKEYRAGYLYDELYEAKEVSRRGWMLKIKKGSIRTKKYENIIEHTYYAWLLGMLYLPDKRPYVEGDDYKEYDKRKILDCLLIHDLAETYVKDKMPEEITEKHKIKENEEMQKIYMHETYADFGKMDAYRMAWNNFRKEGDINGKIAKEIDIIQAIYQFCIYKKQGAVFLDGKEEEWRNEPERIETEIGRKILNDVVMERFAHLFQNEADKK